MVNSEQFNHADGVTLRAYYAMLICWTGLLFSIPLSARPLGPYRVTIAQTFTAETRGMAPIVYSVGFPAKGRRGPIVIWQLEASGSGQTILCFAARGKRRRLLGKLYMSIAGGDENDLNSAKKLHRVLSRLARSTKLVQPLRIRVAKAKPVRLAQLGISLAIRGPWLVGWPTGRPGASRRLLSLVLNRRAFETLYQRHHYAVSLVDAYPLESVMIAYVPWSRTLVAIAEYRAGTEEFVRESTLLDSGPLQRR